MSFAQNLSTFRGHRIPHLDIIGKRNSWFALSGAVIVLSIVGLFVRGLNLSIDFKGGAQLQYPDKSGASVAAIQGVLGRYGRGDAVVTIVNGNTVNVRTQTLNGSTPAETQRNDQLLAALAHQGGISSNDINRTDIGPTWGSEISHKAITGLVIFLLAVTGFIAWRLEWKMAVAAQAALLHDLIITAGIYALVGREVTPATVIAILTILGYSLYDTVVIFDKVGENTESVGLVAREGYSSVVNLSLNQTLMRSVNTSLVVLLPIIALLTFGGSTLKDFAFALAIGVTSGAYSSIFVASPILALLKEREPKIRAMADKRTRQVATRAQPVLAAVGDGGSTASSSDAAAARATARTSGGGGQSRPRSGSKKRQSAKKRRRR